MAQDPETAEDDDFLISDDDRYNARMDDDIRVDDYEDFIDVGRRVHLKLAASVAEALNEATDGLRRRFGITPPKDDRTGPRARGPGDMLFDVARLQLEYLSKLADLTKEHGGDAHRFLERMLLRAGGNSPRPPRLDMQLYVTGGDDKAFEPRRRTLRFVVVNDWKADAVLSLAMRSCVNIETGLAPTVDNGTLVLAFANAGPQPLGGSAMGEVTLHVDQAAWLEPFNAYRVDIDVLVDGKPRKTIELIVTSVPKPALPVLELTRAKRNSGAVPIVNDLGRDASVVCELDPFRDLATHDPTPEALAEVNCPPGVLKKDESTSFVVRETAAKGIGAGTYEAVLRVLLRPQQDARDERLNEELVNRFRVRVVRT